MASYKKALSIRESLSNTNPNDLDLRRELIQNYGKLSDLCWNLGDPNGAMENSRKSMATAQALFDKDNKNQLYRRMLALALLDYGYKQGMVEHNEAEGLENVKKSTQLLEEMVAENPQNVRLRRTLGLSYSRAGEIIANDPKKTAQTLEYYRKALAVHTAVSQADPNNAELRRLAAYDQVAVGGMLASTGNYSEGLQNERAALKIFQDLSARDAGNAELREDIGYLQGEIGQALVSTGDQSSAIRQLRDAMAVLTAIPEAQNKKSRVATMITTNQYWLGKAYTMAAFTTKLQNLRRSNCQEARDWFNKSSQGLDVTGPRAASSSGRDPSVNDIQRDLARCQAVLGTGKPASQ